MALLIFVLQIMFQMHYFLFFVTNYRIFLFQHISETLLSVQHLRHFALGMSA